MTTEERLEKLETELATAERHNCWLLVAVTVLIAGCLAMAATSGNKQTIRATKFAVVDAEGSERAELGAGEHGGLLFLSDKNGQVRVDLAAINDGSMVELFDETGKVRMGLFTTKDGPWLDLFDEKGKVTWSTLGRR